MSEKMSQGTEQALEAFIAEAKKAGLDIEKTVMRAKAGIIGNSTYSWIPTLEKTNAIRALEEAVSEIDKLKNLDV
jgi:hypothetical protein